MTCSADAHCYAQPNTYVLVFAVYCHAHAAWHITADQRTEAAGAEPVLDWQETTVMGPFDTELDVLAAIRTLAGHAPRLRPGGLGSLLD